MVTKTPRVVAARVAGWVAGWTLPAVLLVAAFGLLVCRESHQSVAGLAIAATVYTLRAWISARGFNAELEALRDRLVKIANRFEK